MSASDRPRPDDAAHARRATDALATLRAPPTASTGSPPALRRGESLGRFELVGEFRYGDFAAWEALDRESSRPAAVVPLTRAPGEASLIELEVGARAAHPNLVGVVDAGRHRGGVHVTLELVRGPTLARRLEGGAIPIQEALLVAARIATGLAHVHGLGAVHRNVRPANVLLGGAEPKLLGLGLPPPSDLVPDGTIVPSPEQLAGAPLDARSDVFGLGVILFQMLTGEIPFPDRGAEGRRLLQSLRAGRSPSRAIRRAFAALDELVVRMLATDPATRPSSAAALLPSLKGLHREFGATSASRAIAVRDLQEDCRAFQGELEAVAFRGESPDGALGEHIAACRSCAERWEHERTLFLVPSGMKVRVVEAARREWMEGALERIGPKILRYLRIILEDEDMASDAFSSIAEDLWRGTYSTYDLQSLDAGAFEVACKAASVVRRRREVHEGRSATRPAAGFGTASQREGELLAPFLTAEERNLLVLRARQKFSWKDIAAILGSEPAAVLEQYRVLKTRIARQGSAGRAELSTGAHARWSRDQG